MWGRTAQSGRVYGEKRSIGVTIFGIIFIFSSISSLLTCLINYLNLEKPLVFYGFIASTLLLILGINILRLREWTRKGVIYYYIIATLLGIFLSPSIKNKIIVKSQNSGSAQEEISRYIAINSLSPIYGILTTMLIIYFFTRSKVKEQFK